MKDLQKDFAFKDLGDLHFFLSIGVARALDGIILPLGKHAADLLTRSAMLHAKPVSTPLSTFGEA